MKPDRHRQTRHRCAALLAMLTAVWLAALMMQLGPWAERMPRVTTRYLEHGRDETGAVNIVAAVLLDYRGFDTLGETMVILAAALAVGVLLGNGQLPPAGRGLSVLVRRSIAFLAPLFWVLPVYIIANGHLSPGGGFQGGVALTTLFILLTVVYGTGLIPRVLPPRQFPRLEYTAACGFLVLGLWGMAQGAAYLANLAAGFPRGTPGELLSAGIIPLLNLVIGCKVMAGLSAIFFHMQRNEEPA